MGQPSPRRRQDGVVNWDIWESMNIGKTDCCYPEEQVSLSLLAAWVALQGLPAEQGGEERC